MITHILDALGAPKFTRGYIFPPHCFYIYTRINADVSYALASRGEFYTATEAQQAWVGGEEERINSEFPVGVWKGWWGVCLEKDSSSLLFCCIETVRLDT